MHEIKKFGSTLMGHKRFYKGTLLKPSRPRKRNKRSRSLRLSRTILNDKEIWEQNGASTAGPSSVEPKKETVKNKIPRIKKKTPENVPLRRNPLRNPPPVNRWTPTITHQKRKLTPVVSDSNPDIRDETEPPVNINYLQIKVEVDDDETILKQLPDLGIIQKDSTDATSAASCISSLSHQFPSSNTDEKNILNVTGMYSSGQSSAEKSVDKICTVTSVSLSQHLPETSAVPSVSLSQHLLETSPVPSVSLSQHLPKKKAVPSVSLSQQVPKTSAVPSVNLSQRLPKTSAVPSVGLSQHLPNLNLVRKKPNKTCKVSHGLQPQTVISTCSDTLPATVPFSSPVVIQSDLSMPTPTYTLPQTMSYNLPLQTQTLVLPPTAQNMISPASSQIQILPAPIQIVPTPTYFSPIFLSNNQNSAPLICTETNSLTSVCYACGKVTGNVQLKDAGTDPDINISGFSTFLEFVAWELESIKDPKLQLLAQTEIASIINKIKARDKESFKANPSKECLEANPSKESLEANLNKESLEANPSKESLKASSSSNHPKLINTLDKLNNKDSFIYGASNASKESLETICASNQPKLINSMDKLNKDPFICGVSNPSLAKKSNTVEGNGKSREYATYSNQRNSLEKTKMQTLKEHLIENVSNPSLATLPNTTVTKRNYESSCHSHSDHGKRNVSNEKQSKLSQECTGKTSILKESDMQVTKEQTFASNISNLNITNTSEIAMQDIGNSSKNDSDLNQANVLNKVGSSSDTNSSVTDFSNWMEGLINKNENTGLKNSLENIVSSSRQGRRLSYIDVKARKDV